MFVCVCLCMCCVKAVQQSGDGDRTREIRISASCLLFSLGQKWPVSCHGFFKMLRLEDTGPVMNRQLLSGWLVQDHSPMGSQRGSRLGCSLYLHSNMELGE